MDAAQLSRLAAWSRHLTWTLAALGLFITALWVLHRETAGIRFADVAVNLRSVPWGAVLVALGFTTASYAALTGYDWLALRHIGRPLAYPGVALTSFVATAVGHNLGVAMLSGGAVRYRLYSAAGLSAAEIATVIGLVGLTFGLGVSFVIGVIMLLGMPETTQILRLPQPLVQGVGATLLVMILLYAIWGAVRRTPLQLRGWQLAMPGPGTTALQITFAALDIGFAAAVLYVLLPAQVQVSYPHLLSIYVLAIGAGIISHVPGGLGVFESVLLLALPDAPRDALLGGVLAYRIVYYLLPLGLAALTGMAQEAHLQRAPINRGLRLVNVLMRRAAPQLLTVLVFIAGAILVFSGATPALGERLEILNAFLPLPLLELSHMAGSLTGLALMLLAYGLQRRVNAAYHLAFWLLAFGALVSLAKGLDFEEACIAGLTLAALYSGRKAFYRQSSLSALRLSPGWAALVVMVVAGSLWLGMFAYRHIDYAQELWWQFALASDAPRFLRASLLLILAGTGYASLRLLQPRAPEPQLPDATALQRAATIVLQSPHSDATLALVGDKRLLFSPSGNAFIMYQVRGGSWIAMGDPVGAEAEREALAWQFRELSNHHGGRTIFYQVDAENLPMYVDMGMVLLKLGEEALIPLQGFSLQGSARAELRQVHRRAQREGASFKIIPPERVSALIPQMRAISDEWLAAKNTREKGFALGRFDPAYLGHCHCALVYIAGQPVAFGNLWTGDGKTEISVDLMRHATAVPNGIMDYLFVELFLWGAAQGYRYCNLGMAPLSGLESHPLAPLWHQLGTLVFRHGEHFYNFEGLRAYKQKFHPEWRPKYLAASRGLGLPTALLDVTALISGGIKGVFSR
ncbi:MAG: bifunctional lysylphosphatidylglycerol flippase/synthetase MprF [Chromatiaceae bacterium]|jgi:phosphatidylglycerol lysyltransferase|nr:bifunctional lysylphosphatidylglycerol flippase/synthetase MprF [Chromatiaceae bacterium]